MLSYSLTASVNFPISSSSNAAARSCISLNSLVPENDGSRSWYFSKALLIATTSPLHSWQIPALRRCPLTPYFNRLLLTDCRAISSNISIALGYLIKQSQFEY
nr:hypothetical protein Iba_chr02aCG22570 [Ipomoea batatas]GMC61804.1 hypothetical protein Iba_chr02bCG23540 [Ipomoea batatas]GME12678.1 hypothetical protein Iba_scaffold14043CG0370 [Ipomoea batatas]